MKFFEKQAERLMSQSCSNNLELTGSTYSLLRNAFPFLHSSLQPLLGTTTQRPRCPHDSWIESLTIDEPATGGRLQNRSLLISARLLGAFHDGHLLLGYADVQNVLTRKP